MKYEAWKIIQEQKSYLYFSSKHLEKEVLKWFEQGI